MTEGTMTPLSQPCHHIQYYKYEIDSSGNLVRVLHEGWVSDEQCREWARQGKQIRGYNLP